MSNPRDNHRDDLLARLLIGELSMASPEIRAAMNQDPEFARKAAELSSFAEAIEEACSPMPPADLGPEPWTGADAAMRELVRRELGGPGTAGTVRAMPRRPWFLALAAAAVLALAFGLWPSRCAEQRSQPGPEHRLGNGEELVTTRDAFAKEGLSWPAPPSVKTHRIQLFGDDGGVIPMADGSDHFDATGATWRPSSDFVATLPGTFTMIVSFEMRGLPPPRWQNRVTFKD